MALATHSPTSVPFVVLVRSLVLPVNRCITESQHPTLADTFTNPSVWRFTFVVPPSDQLKEGGRLRLPTDKT
eukprot:gene11522-biopygen4125